MYSFANLKPSTATLPYQLGTPLAELDSRRVTISGFEANDPRSGRTSTATAARRATITGFEANDPRSAGQPVARAATNRRITFGSSSPTVPMTSNLDFGTLAPRSGNPLFPTSATEFLRTASFGRSTSDTRVTSPGTYDDAILRAGREVERIQKVQTATIDGGTGTLDSLRQGARDILASLGSSGDGEIIQASWGDGDGGGINPLWIAGAAVVAGLIYYNVAK